MKILYPQSKCFYIDIPLPAILAIILTPHVHNDKGEGAEGVWSSLLERLRGETIGSGQSAGLQLTSLLLRRRVNL